MGGCSEQYGLGIEFWTGGQRIDPTRNTDFVWKITPADSSRETVYPMTYTNWATHQPNFLYGKQSCMHLYNKYEWNDDNRSNASCSVCEIDIM